MDKIAVITPCFNGAKFVTECIESVEKSVTLGEFEVEHILVDDCSTDNTKAILSKQRTINIFRTTNGGPSLARNDGLAATDSKYVFFLDVDDILFANSLRYLYRVAEDNKSNWVFGDFVRGDEQGKYLLGEDYYGWHFEDVSGLLTSLYSGKHFFQQNSLFLKSEVDEVGRFESEIRMGEDFDLCTRLLLKKIMPIYLPGPLYMHRFHGSNLSVKLTQDPEQHRIHVREMFGKYEADLKKVLSSDQLGAVHEFLR